MAFLFPSSPALNDTYTYNSITWTYNGKGWIKATSGGGGGGGYNGGSVPDSNTQGCGSGGGGSSFVGNGATLVTDVQTNTGHGSVIITKI